MKRVRSVANVGTLPTEVFGAENLTWWGAVGGEVIEGFVLILGVFAWFYLRADSSAWPSDSNRSRNAGTGSFAIRSAMICSSM